MDPIKCPSCGKLVDMATAVKKDIEGHSYAFCSGPCAEAFAETRMTHQEKRHEEDRPFL
jgi:YHS domain-containing protein